RRVTERAASSPTRAWGLGLMALGGALGALLVLWLLVTAVGGDLRGGGFVLGLVLVVVGALALMGAGYFLVRRGAAEAQSDATFEARRRGFEGARVFRQQAAADLRGVAARLDGREPAARLTELAAAVAAAPRDESAWYESDPLADADLATLRRYEDTLQADSDRAADLRARTRPRDPAAP